MIANGWIQAAGLVLLVGFFIMGVLTFYTYNDEPPIPEVVKDARGQALFSRGDVMAGQGIFLSNGLPGVRFDLRPRRLPWPRFHRRISSSCRLGQHRLLQQV
jgi:hypothetical protein